MEIKEAPDQEELASKLRIIARGDDALVRRALATCKVNCRADLLDVVEYILSVEAMSDKGMQSRLRD